MKTVKFLYVFLFLLLTALSTLCRADDTDLFLVNAAVAQQRPNVLIVLDNTANWNQPFTFEKAALVSVVNGLTDQFNVGLMLFTETGSTNPTPYGAYMRYAMRQMTEDDHGVPGNATNLANLVNGLDILLDKSDGGKAGVTMYEAWQYYAGLASFAGGPPGAGNGKAKSDDGSVYGGSGAFVAGSGIYNSPKSNGCQNNFIVYISNGPVQDNSSDTSDATDKLASLGGNTNTITVNPNGSQSNIADEYARFFATTSSTTGLSNIITYTIDVLPGSTGQGPGWTALLKSMAQVGKGKYFVSNDQISLTTALTSIFNEVMAVNSVFSSSTLPVNVSVRGTYLNQVYMAVFRPDAHLSPRWTGNLKQYKLGYTAETDTLYLADKNGLAAENTISGFITPLATSVWTTASTFWNSSYYPDAQGESSTPTSDAPDGSLVEKGGSAQHARVDYTYSSSQPVRNIYTCTGSCTANSVLSGYPFANSNADVSVSALGLTSNTVTATLVHTGTTATATASNHGFSTGQTITIAGATQAEYNGSYVITRVDDNKFTYTIVENPVTPATVAAGQTTILATKQSNAYPLLSITRSGTVATAKLASGYSLSTGSIWNGNLNIAGAAQSEYNGVKPVTLPAGTSTQFNYTVAAADYPEGPTQPTVFGSSAPGYNIAGCTSYANAAMTRSTGTSAVTAQLPSQGNSAFTPQDCFPPGSTVSITGATPSDYNVTTAVITSKTTRNCYADNKKTCIATITFNLPQGITAAYSSPVTPATRAVNTVSLSFDTTWSFSNVSLITRSGTTATATTSVAHSFSTGDVVCITRAAQSEYNVCAAITRIGTTNSTQFTYPVTISPASPATTTGTITATNPLISSLSRSQLINWSRGQNNQLNDNPSQASTDVRGYTYGDVLHSRPAVINYNRTGQPTGRDIVAYFGANDGMFHAVKGGDTDADGDEKWGFIPLEHFANLQRLYTVSPLIGTATPKPYFTDGSVGFYTYDANNDGQLTADSSNDTASVFLSMRRGGRFYYALNVIDPDAPKFLWKKSNASAGYGELGLTWSEPKPATIRYQANPVVIFGLGYDAAANDATTQGTATMGRGVMVADAVTGAPIWQAGPAPIGATYTKTVSGMTYSISADPVVLDTNSDGYADRIYVADTGGNVWRINIDNATPSNWTVYKVASVGGTGANARKFLYPPDVVYATGYDAVLIGSGDREHPSDTTVLNRYYMFKDSHCLQPLVSTSSTKIFCAVPTSAPENTYVWVKRDWGTPGPTLAESDLYDATGNLVQVGTSSEKSAAVTSINGRGGWYVTLGKLDSSTGAYLPIGEKVVGGSISLGGATYFATNVPAVSLGNTNACTSNLGESRLYAVSYQNGSAVLDLDKTSTSSSLSGTSTSTVLTTSDRYTIQPGGGYAPSPVAAVVILNGAPREAVIIGTSVMQTPRQDLNRRHSIYWGLPID